MGVVGPAPDAAVALGPPSNLENQDPVTTRLELHAARRTGSLTKLGLMCLTFGYQATAALLLRLCEAARNSPVFGSRLIATHSPSPPKRTLLESYSL